MKILISNDDGVHAPGLMYLANALEKTADITVVAPDRNRSGVSNSLTLENPLRVVTASNGYYSVNGTPTDCVHLAVTGLLKEMPDMVVSGINEGSNLSDDVLYSGTVAAATEGRFLGLPSIAISLAGPRCEHYDTAAQIAKILVERLRETPLTSDTILNVNVPDVPFAELRGIQVTRLGTRHIAEPTIKAIDPRGRKIYWVGQPGPEQDAGPGTDFYAVNTGYVSVTPLHLDLTHYKVLDELSNWVQPLQIG
ncbi:5'-nucleotidase SurE [Aquicella siphonis]|uniref:5'-nucleotidase SurE n=1 Tax=Aquicella siphonis TaxID=254247 RepID=A0A5E4PGM4_9COXI|nr:5'/3'-nucleotidase SurE [Aquicella siphonis]VVC76190.1 5'-nucleotidase SurE [Aquicella siphonis]